MTFQSNATRVVWVSRRLAISRAARSRGLAKIDVNKTVAATAGRSVGAGNDDSREAHIVARSFLCLNYICVCCQRVVSVISCLHDQTLGAGQPVAFISTRMAVFLAKRRPRRVLRAARKLRDLLHQGARIHPRVLVDTCCTYCRRTKTDLESTSRA